MFGRFFSQASRSLSSSVIKNVGNGDASYTGKVLRDAGDGINEQVKNPYEELARRLIDRNMSSPENFLRWNYPYEGSEYNLPGYNSKYNNKIVLPTGDKNNPWHFLSKERILKAPILIGGKDTGIHPGLARTLMKEGVFPKDGHVAYMGYNAYVQDSYARELHRNPDFFDEESLEVAESIYSCLEVKDKELKFRDPADKLHVLTYSAGQKTLTRILNALSALVDSRLKDDLNPAAFQRFCEQNVRTRGLAIAPLVWKSKTPRMAIPTFSEFGCTDIATTPLPSMYLGIYFNQRIWENPYTLLQIYNPRFPDVPQFMIVYGKDAVPTVLPDGKPNVLGHSPVGVLEAGRKCLPKEIKDVLDNYFTLSPEEFKDRTRMLAERAESYQAKPINEYPIAYQSAGYEGLVKIIAANLEAQDKAREALKSKKLAEKSSMQTPVPTTLESTNLYNNQESAKGR